MMHTNTFRFELLPFPIFALETLVNVEQYHSHCKQKAGRMKNIRRLLQISQALSTVLSPSIQPSMTIPILSPPLPLNFPQLPSNFNDVVSPFASSTSRSLPYPYKLDFRMCEVLVLVYRAFFQDKGKWRTIRSGYKCARRCTWCRKSGTCFRCQLGFCLLRYLALLSYR